MMKRDISMKCPCGFIYVTFTIQQQIQQCKSVLAVYVKNMYVYILYIDENIKGTRGGEGL